jgi:5-methylcytosine-specific restriction endonuclease McrA
MNTVLSRTEKPFSSYALSRTPENRFRRQLKQWINKTYIEHGQKYIITFSKTWLLNLALASPNCNLCGKPFEIGHNANGKRVNRRSLDRTNNDLILTTSNVQIICVSCNARKKDMTLSAYLSLIGD